MTGDRFGNMPRRRFGMARKEQAGEYQIGIWNVSRQGRRDWLAVATGPGTIGDGSPQHFPTLRAAYRAITGEDVT